MGGGQDRAPAFALVLEPEKAGAEAAHFLRGVIQTGDFLQALVIRRPEVFFHQLASGGKGHVPAMGGKGKSPWGDSLGFG